MMPPLVIRLEGGQQARPDSRKFTPNVARLTLVADPDGFVQLLRQQDGFEDWPLETITVLVAAV